MVHGFSTPDAWSGDASWRLGVEFDAACLQAEAPAHVLVSLASAKHNGKAEVAATTFFASAAIVTAPSAAVLQVLCHSGQGRRLLQHLQEAADHLGDKCSRFDDDATAALCRQLDEDLCSAHAALLELDEHLVTSSSCDGGNGGSCGDAGSCPPELSREVQRWLQQAQAFVMAAQKDIADSCGDECDVGDVVLAAMQRWRRNVHWDRWAAVAQPKLALLRSGADAALDEMHRQEVEKAREEQAASRPRALAVRGQRQVVSRRSRLPYYAHWAKKIAM